MGLWVLGGFGFNVPTVLWIQTTILEISIVALVAWLLRLLRPVIARLPIVIKALDDARENEADRELSKMRERRDDGSDQRHP
jgi:hypothetical protein